MPELALYRKYRPHSFDTVVGQDHITKTLANGLKRSGPAHAYLFTGPHGVGKTSVARILAHELNSLPYSDAQHLDIIEIDAASNRRIDEIRELRDKINVAPSSAPFKVYIIDEVHMLTKEAFNALLKTLEEPPAHAVLILATTEAHKLPETIVSRTQRYGFKSVTTQDLVDHLQTISKKESIAANTEALALIAEHAKGSVRDAVSLLEQLSGDAAITIEHVERSLGMASATLVQTLLRAIAAGDIASVATEMTSAKQKGVSATVLSQQLIDALRSQQPSKESLQLIDQLLNVSDGLHQQIRLETTLLKAALSAQPQQNNPQPQKATPPMKQPEPAVTAEPEPVEPLEVAKTQKEPAPVETAVVEASTPPTETKPFDATVWKEVLSQTKEINNSLYAVLRMATPAHDEASSTLHLKFKFPFHQKRLAEERNKRQTETILTELTGSPLRINAVHDPEVKKEPEVFVRNGVSSDVESVIDVMGGGEVVDL